MVRVDDILGAAEAIKAVKDGLVRTPPLLVVVVVAHGRALVAGPRLHLHSMSQAAASVLGAGMCVVTYT